MESWSPLLAAPGCSLCRWESPECPPPSSPSLTCATNRTRGREGNGTKAASSDGGKEGGGGGGLFGGLPAFPIAADGSEAEAWREGRGRSAEVGKSTTQSRNGTRLEDGGGGGNRT